MRGDGMNYPTFFGNQPQNGQQFPQNGGMPPRPDMPNYQQQQEQMRQQMMMQQAQIQNAGQQQQSIPQHGFSPTSRIVASREEAAAVTADFTGALMIFPDIAHNRVYVKQWDNGKGEAVFSEYVPFVPNAVPQPSQQTQDQKAQFASARDLKDLYDMVEDLTKEVDQLKKSGKEGCKT